MIPDNHRWRGSGPFLLQWGLYNLHLLESPNNLVKLECKIQRNWCTVTVAPTIEYNVQKHTCTMSEISQGQSLLLLRWCEGQLRSYFMISILKKNETIRAFDPPNFASCIKVNSDGRILGHVHVCLWDAIWSEVRNMVLKISQTLNAICVICNIYSNLYF